MRQTIIEELGHLSELSMADFQSVYNNLLSQTQNPSIASHWALSNYDRLEDGLNNGVVRLWNSSFEPKIKSAANIR